MEITEEELLHIANLANLNIEKDEIDNYLANLKDILDFANALNKIPVDNLKEKIGSSTNTNVFRKDEIIEFEDKEALLKNAPEKEQNMFKIPKVL